MTVTTKNGTFTPQEIQNYKDYLEEKFPNCEVVDLYLEGDEKDPEYVNMKYTLANKPSANLSFVRIRRITGYLVSTLDKWNSAKRAEEQDRVKHTRIE